MDPKNILDSDFLNRPKADVKVSMARAVVEEFPFLKDEEGQGFVSINQLSFKATL